MASLGERIVERIEVTGISQAELARRVGITQPAINHMIKRGTGGTSHLHQIARELKTSPAYLLGETDDPREGFLPTPTMDDVANEFGLVQMRELDLSLGMGATYLDLPVTEISRHFDRGWLRLYTHADPEHLLFAQGVGDSMMPTLLDSDLLLIDCSQQSITMTDKIWAVAYAECGAVKRLRQRADGCVEMISDNPNVANDIAFDGELHVLGRVVAVIRKM